MADRVETPYRCAAGARARKGSAPALRGARSMASTPTADDLDIVARIAVFGGLTPATIQRIVGPATVVTLHEREPLFRQGDPATAFFIVIEGWIKLYRITFAG